MIPAQREAWIDQARGIGILLVLLGHAPLPEPAINALYLFHVPLFFFLSGNLLKAAKADAPMPHLRSRLVQLGIPYLIFGTAGFIALAVAKAMGIVQSGHFQIDTAATGLLFGIRDSSPFLGPLWFLCGLFLTEATYLFLHRLVGRLRAGIAVMLLFVAGWLSCQAGLSKLPYSLDLVPLTLPFLGAGNLYGGHRPNKPSLRILLVAASMLGIIVAYMGNGRVDISWNQIGNPILFLLGGIGGSILLLEFARNLPPIPGLELTGRLTLPLLAMHSWLVFPIVKRLLHAMEGAIPLSSSPPVAALVYLVSGWVFLVPLSLLLGRFLPALVGWRPQPVPNNSRSPLG